MFSKNLEEHIEGFKAEFYLREGVKPMFYKAYEAPIKLKEKVENQLDRLCLTYLLSRLVGCY